MKSLRLLPLSIFPKACILVGAIFLSGCARGDGIGVQRSECQYSHWFSVEQGNFSWCRTFGSEDYSLHFGIGEEQYNRVYSVPEEAHFVSWQRRGSAMETLFYLFKSRTLLTVSVAMPEDGSSGPDLSEHRVELDALEIPAAFRDIAFERLHPNIWEGCASAVTYNSRLRRLEATLIDMEKIASSARDAIRVATIIVDPDIDMGLWREQRRPICYRSGGNDFVAFVNLTATGQLAAESAPASINIIDIAEARFEEVFVTPFGSYDSLELFPLNGGVAVRTFAEPTLNLFRLPHWQLEKTVTVGHSSQLIWGTEDLDLFATVDRNYGEEPRDRFSLWSNCVEEDLECRQIVDLAPGEIASRAINQDWGANPHLLVSDVSGSVFPRQITENLSISGE